MSEELKPCPFCGPCTNKQIYKHGPDEPDCFVQCDACTTCGPSAQSPELAASAWNRRSTPPSPSTASEGSELPPAEHDAGMDRHYLPLPGGWEVQTKGKGSTFRIAHVPSGDRWMVLDDDLHEPLERMARDARAALASKPVAREVDDLLRKLVESYPNRLDGMYCDGEPVGRKLMAIIAANASTDAASRCRAQGGNTQPSGAEVDVEAERKLFEKEANNARFFPREINFDRIKSPSGRDMVYVNSHLQSRWEGWLAARTQVPAQTGSGEEGKATPEAFAVLEDVFANSEAFYKVRVKIDGCNNVAIHYEDMDEVWLDELRAAIAATQTKESQPKQIAAAPAPDRRQEGERRS